MSPSPAFYVFSVSLLIIAACLTMMIVRALMGRVRQATTRFREPATPETPSGIWIVLMLAFGFLIGGYYVLRYHGLWTESDTATITLAIESIRKNRTLIPEGFLYQHGFGYQANSITLMLFTGLSTQALQTQFYPFLAVVGLVLTSYVFFREVLRDGRVAMLASMFLLFQPEIMFVTLRGSHEKITWPLMMLALTLLYRSIGQPLRKMSIYVVLFYVVVFAMDTTNVFFGSVFLVAVVLSMSLGFFLFRFWRNNRPPLPRVDIQRLMYISFSGGILIYFFIAYIYPPALTNLRMLRNILDQLSALLLSFEVKAQPYGYISTGWVNSQVYLMLTVFTWLVIGTSFLEWLHHGWNMFKGRTAQGLIENLDWLLYTGFAVQIALSIGVDLSGALAANMQLRLFPSFTVIAIVLLVRLLSRILSGLRWPAAARSILVATAGILSAWFTLASLLKSTNEPALSNKWTFYVPADKASVDWVENHLEGAEIWTIIDERLATIFNSYHYLDSETDNHLRFGAIRPSARYVLATQLDRARAERLRIDIPPLDYWDQIYDNGQAQIGRIPLSFLENP
jgi:hypothetical protein